MSRSDFNAPSTNMSDPEKTNVAREAMGLQGSEEGGGGGSGKVHAPKFHSMHIASAANGSIVKHTKHPPAMGSEKSTKVLVPHGHPMHKHIQALSNHCEDCV